MQQLIDRLSFQIHSFQEGFETLSKINSLQGIAKQFMHILRGNLMLVEVNLFYKSTEHKQWQELYVSKKGSESFICNFEEAKSFRINYLNDPRIKICVTQPMIDGSYFGIMLGQKLDKSGFNDLDKISLPIFLQLLDHAYQSYLRRCQEKELTFALNLRVLQLNSLIDTGIEVTKLQHGDTLLHLALERALALTNASKAMLCIKDGHTEKQKFFFPAPFQVKYKKTAKYRIVTRFKFSKLTYSLYLFEKESRRGIIPFEETDQLLLDAFARQIYVSLENYYLHEQALEMKRIDQEISVAGAIQKKLIPEQLPFIAGFDIAGKYIPTKYIGGDYYDCIPLRDGRYALIIADVAGKGIPASLLVSTLHAYLHAYLEGPFDLANLAQTLNKVIYNASTVDKFITAFIATLNPGTGELESVNAGHNPTYIVRNNKNIEELKSSGLPFGMIEAPFPYQIAKTALNRGDRILLYTDGVTESMNDNEEEYDNIISLHKFLEKNNPTRALEFINLLINDINQFTGAKPQTDDITVLYLIRT